MEEAKKVFVFGHRIYEAPVVKVLRVELEGAMAQSYEPGVGAGGMNYTDYDSQTESSGDVLIF